MKSMAFCVAVGLFLRPEVDAVGKPNQTPNVVAVATPVLDGGSAMDSQAHGYVLHCCPNRFSLLPAKDEVASKIRKTLEF